jgi:hypothetical protein
LAPKEPQEDAGPGPSSRKLSLKEKSQPNSARRSKTPAKTPSTKPNGTQTVAAATKPTGVPTIATVAATHSIPVMLPEKLSAIKVLMELENTDELHGATDLSGDSGAIGRIVVQPGTSRVQVDLKGVLYNATIIPAPVSMAVVNIGASEAKVESLFSSFIQLREDTEFAAAHGTGVLDGLFGEDDDDDMYAVGDEGEEGGKNGKKKAKAAAVGGAKKKAVGAGKGRGGGVGGARKTTKTTKVAAGKKSRGGGVKKTAGRK